MILLAIGLAWGDPGTWERARSHQSDHLALPAALTRAQTRELIRDLAEAAPGGTLPPTLAEEAARVGLQLEQVGDVVYLSDRPRLDRGAGFLAMRLGPLTTELVLEAPHPMSDENTGSIVGGIFDLGEVRVACFATNARDAGRNADPVDLGRSWLSVMTHGLADGLQDPLFVQVHGFDPSTSVADAVLSPGVRFVEPDEWATAFRRIAVGLAASDIRGPEEVPNLAAHDNMQGRILARRGLRFWHLELSASLREGLRVNRSNRLALRDQLLLLAARAVDPG